VLVVVLVGRLVVVAAGRLVVGRFFEVADPQPPTAAATTTAAAALSPMLQARDLKGR